MPTLLQRFQAKVNTNGPIPAHCPELGPCHIWTGKHSKRGYGSIKVGTRWVQAHRLGWEFENGPMPLDKLACHRCDNPPCVRGTHVYPGTSKDNTRDMMQRGRWPRLDRSGEHNGFAKLCRSQVVSIRERFDQGGITKQDLANDYGVSRKAIREVVLGVTWK